MDIGDFMKKNNIAIFAEGNIKENRFVIWKRNFKLENRNIYEQLILDKSVNGLLDYMDGQIMPRIWSQGKTKAVICKPTDNRLIVIFTDNGLDAKEIYLWSKDIEKKIRELYLAN